MPPKRKAAHLDDSDDEEPAYGRQILPVAKLPDSFEGEPTDGLQYLFTVRREFQQLPHVTRVANPYELPAIPPAQTAPVGPSRLPSPEWRTSFEKKFKNFRQNVAQIADPFEAGHANGLRRIEKSLPDKKDREKWWLFLQGAPEYLWNPPKRPKVDRERRRQHGRDRVSAAEQLLGPWTPVDAPVPPTIASQPTRDGSGLGDDCETLPYSDDPASVPPIGVQKGPFAAPENYSIPVKAPMLTPAEATSPSDGPSTAVSPMLKPPEPTPVLLRGVDAKYAAHLLMYFAHWVYLHLEHCEETKNVASPTPSPHAVTPTHLRWIFALLARVEETPSADDMAHLRSLARGCVGLIKVAPDDTRTSANSSSSTQEEDGTTQAFAAGCWMVVGAVAGAWSQRDLWQDAEEALASV